MHVAVAALGLCIAASEPRAQLARIATTPGDGSVSVDVDAYGAFGYRSFGNFSLGPGDAVYDPVGSVGPSSTSWQSAVYLRMPPQSTFMTIGNVGTTPSSGLLPDPGFTSTSGTIATSAFSHAGLDWQLKQSVEDILVGPDRLGSLLVQRYQITNPGPAPISFDLVRYYEGDLWLGLGAGVPDGGGRLQVSGEDLLFQTDLAGEPADTTNFVGITACGGTAPNPGRYEVNQWPAFPGRIGMDMPLGDVVYQDFADPDQFVDAGFDYDVGIALANTFTLAPGQTAVYLTTTAFGQLPPEALSEGCSTRAGAVADGGPDRAACPGATVQLDGSASFDADSVVGGGTVSWSWDFDTAVDSDADTITNDDVDATGAVVQHAFPTGVTIVQLTYADDDGESDTDLVTVTIGDTIPPAPACLVEVDAPATSYAGGPATVGATATDDCDPAPVITNDRTPGGADASDDYPCGRTLVTFTATDALGNSASCATIVRIVPPAIDWPVGPALRVSRQADGRPLLDWSLVGPTPPEVRFTVLRGEARRPPVTIAPGASSITATTWAEPDVTGPLVFYDVRTAVCDGTLSQD